MASQMTDVEFQAPKVSVEEQMKQITASNTFEKDLAHDVEDLAGKVSAEEHMKINTIKTMEKDLDHALSETKRLKDETDKKTKTKGEICSDVEDPAAQVSVEGQMVKDLAHGFEGGNLKLVDDDEDEGKALRLLFEDEEDKKIKEWATLSFYQSTEWIGGVGDAFGANCWFD